jgi:hypothetical protein
MLMHSTHIAGPRILRALGLPTEGCLSLSIHFDPNAAVIARAEYTVTEEGLQALQDLAPGMQLEVKATTFASPGAFQGHAHRETKGEGGG